MHHASGNSTYLTTLITCCNVDFGLVNETNDLEVVLCIEPLSTSDGTRGNEASAVSRRGAPRDLTLLRGTY